PGEASLRACEVSCRIRARELPYSLPRDSPLPRSLTLPTLQIRASRHHRGLRDANLGPPLPAGNRAGIRPAMTLDPTRESEILSISEAVRRLRTHRKRSAGRACLRFGGADTRATLL